MKRYGLNKGLFRLISLALLLALLFTSAGTGIVHANPDPGWYDANWAYRKIITTDHTKVPNTDQTDFPVLINRTDADFTKARTDGYDFVFSQSDGTTELKYEREKWDDGTGELIAWVKVPSLSSTVDTDIYIYYGNAAQGTDKADPENVWDTNYKLVQHLKDITTSTTATTDSTTNANNGTKKAADEPAEADGKIGKGQDFSDDYITVSDSVELRGMSALTIKAWIYADTKTNWACILEKADEKEDERKFHPQQI